MSTRASLVKFIVFVVATLVATGTLAATIANTQFGDKNTYHAVFQDVTGLAAGQEVRIAGVRVGEVKAIAVDKDRIHAEVTYTIHECGYRTRFFDRISRLRFILILILISRQSTTTRRHNHPRSLF